MRGNPNIKELGKAYHFKKGMVKTSVKPLTSYKSICERLGIESKVKLTNREKREMTEALLEMSIAQLEKLSKDKRIPVFLKTVAAALVKSDADGSLSAWNDLNDRFYGKASQEIVTVKKEVIPTVDNLKEFTPEELSEHLAKEAVKVEN